MSMSPEMGVIKPMALLPFPPDQVGTYSCHGVEPGMRQGETSAKINQDRGCVIYPFGQEACPEFEQALFCVFDGHGACGDKVSQFTAEKVPELLEKHPKLKLNPATALEEAFVTVDRNLKEDATIDAELSGTTAVVVLLRKDAAKGTITAYTANAGDSRAVLGTLAPGAPASDLVTMQLTVDHKPTTTHTTLDGDNIFAYQVQYFLASHCSHHIDSSVRDLVRLPICTDYGRLCSV